MILILYVVYLDHMPQCFKISQKVSFRSKNYKNIDLNTRNFIFEELQNWTKRCCRKYRQLASLAATLYNEKFCGNFRALWYAFGDLDMDIWHAVRSKESRSHTSFAPWREKQERRCDDSTTSTESWLPSMMLMTFDEISPPA